MPRHYGWHRRRNGIQQRGLAWLSLARTQPGWLRAARLAAVRCGRPWPFDDRRSEAWAGIGAARKNLSLGALTAADGTLLGLSADQSLLIAACLAPTALVGGLFGAHLTHALPLKWIRLAFILLMAWASANMLLGR